MAEAVGVTESFVSQVERGVANPSVATLRRMAEALGEPWRRCSSTARGTVSRQAARDGRPGRATSAAAPPGRVGQEYLLTPPSAKTLEIMYAILDAGSGSGDEPYTHQGDEECVIVIAGQLEVGMNGELHHLAAGDALLLDPEAAAHLPQPRPRPRDHDVGAEPAGILSLPGCRACGRTPR